MAEKVKTFDEFKKDCKFKGVFDQRCIHEFNPKYRKVGSCSFNFCPLKKEMNSKDEEN
jgi:hypothetical protein